MKHFFKYASGYINVDEHNLYLTNSGNWQEALGLNEKSSATIKQNSRRLGWNNIFINGVLVASAVIVLFMIENQILSIGLVVGMAIALYKVNTTFGQESGKRYKIPLSKIVGVDKFEDGLKIEFLNESGAADYEIVHKVDPKGIAFLMQNHQLIALKSHNGYRCLWHRIRQLS